MFSKLLKATKSEKDLEVRIVEIVTELCHLMDLKAPIVENKVKEN